MRPLWVRIWVDYIQEVLFKAIITISSFIALFIANQIVANLKMPGISTGGTIPINEVGAGTVILLFSLSLWGIVGAGVKAHQYFRNKNQPERQKAGKKDTTAAA